MEWDIKIKKVKGRCVVGRGANANESLREPSLFKIKGNKLRWASYIFCQSGFGQ